MHNIQIALLTPGEMGSAIALRLQAAGLTVVTCLEGRSPRTKALAASAGVADVGSLAELVRNTPLILSVVPPERARQVAHGVASAVRETRASPTYVDCNAIAPTTVNAVAAEIEAAGGHAIDVGIIGYPPGSDGSSPRFYASGADLKALEPLIRAGLDVRPIGPRIGQASGLKMTYAALSKGTTAIGTELLVAAKKMGLFDELIDVLTGHPTYERLRASVPRVPAVAHRWSGEMEEIALTFAELGLPSRTFEGAADLYRWVEGTRLGTERPETRDRGRDLAATISALAIPDP